jgi:hypothetical protein
MSTTAQGPSADPDNPPSMPQLLSTEQVSEYCRGGPDMRTATFALIGDQIYRNEPDGWRRLDNKPCATVQEFVEHQNVG